jgi:hypothetical protein
MVVGPPKILPGSRVFVRTGKIDGNRSSAILSVGPKEGGENMKNSTWVIVSAVLLGACQSGAAAAEKKYGPGVTDTEIKVGQTVPYSGPA